MAQTHACVANCLADSIHRASRDFVDRSSVVVTKTITTKELARNRYLAFSASDAAWGQTVRQIRYKFEWAGKRRVVADRFFSSRQPYSAFKVGEEGDEKLGLPRPTCRYGRFSHRGFVADLDDKALQNLRQLGWRRAAPDSPPPWTSSRFGG